jgi:DNA-directed RNA polymerase subunit M/transcription elongation factor TFIIS
MSKFCRDCSSLLTAITVTAELKFHCISCGKRYDSEPEDTLRSEKFIEYSEQNDKFGIFISNSPFDPVSKKVDISCPNCNMPYLTKIYIGDDVQLLYTCTCGGKFTKNDLFAEKPNSRKNQPNDAKDANDTKE